MKPKSALILLIFLIMIGLSIFSTALFLLIESGEEDAPFFIIYVIISFFLLIAIFFSIKTIRKKVKNYSEKEIAVMNSLKWHKYAELKNQDIKSLGFIEEWTIPAAEWKAFKTFEKKERRSQIIIEIILIVVIGTSFLMIVSEAKFLISLIISSVLSGIYAIGRFSVENWKYASIPEKDVKIYFFKDFLLVNNKIFVLNDEDLNFNKVELKTQKGLNILEFESWYYSSKNSKIFTDIKIPISEAHLTKAQKLIEYYQKKL